MYYYFQFESNQILSHYGWYKSLIIYLTLLFDVSSRCRWWRWLDGLARFWVDGKIGGGWSGWSGWSGWRIVNTRNRGIGCQQGVNKSIGGGRGGCRWLGGCSRFPVITRIQYDGFLWGFGVETPDGYQSPGWTILVVLEVVDSLGQCTNRQFVGVMG